MKLRDLNPSSPSDVTSWLAVATDARSVDAPNLPPPCRQDFVGGVEVPWPGQRHRYLVAEDAGDVVGILDLTFPELDNRDNVEAELMVRPDARRRGIGTALFRAAVAEARREGRKRIIAESVRTLPGGPPRSGVGSLFARTTGARLALTEVERVLDLTAVDRGAWRVEADRLAAAASGYSLLSWVGPPPDEVVEDLAAMDSRFLSEAPMRDLTMEPERVDVARMRAADRSKEARGRLDYGTVARYDATGEVVAWTELNRFHCPDSYLDQAITLVLPEHRGHRLGLLTKLVNHLLMLDAEPAATTVATWNAEENPHMIGINQALGFRPVALWDIWQLEL